ncbi:MAG: hypothetical protein Q9210_003937 [Variospora velana]
MTANAPNYTTDLTECQFLKSLGYDLNITNSFQLNDINERATFHLDQYEKLHDQLQSQITHLRCHLSKAKEISSQNVEDFCSPFQDLMVKTAAHISILRDLVERATKQNKDYRNMSLQLGVPNGPPLPIPMESLFRPGQRITIVWGGKEWSKEVDIDELSIKSDQGDNHSEETWIDEGRSRISEIVQACDDDISDGVGEEDDWPVVLTEAYAERLLRNLRVDGWPVVVKKKQGGRRWGRKKLGGVRKVVEDIAHASEWEDCSSSGGRF